VAVSIVVPCYNSAPWLADTMASLTAQTLTSLEIVLVDDGGRGGTRALIGELIAAHPARRIRAIFQDNVGVGAAQYGDHGCARRLHSAGGR